ncbi:hypothetical protein [uncultured Akkermansia sp.]|uniref:hypothetical protein n=1 Tax=uncultured Akkermansia sp. TaxID=512294 RepID=UPI0025F1E114|nr:hypothetical protein [uncultured Akkermansia sp.]
MNPEDIHETIPFFHHTRRRFDHLEKAAEADEVVCVIDLDTVMPGSVLYDFGDMVRTMTSPTAEDEEDPDKTFMRMPMFEAVIKGYLEPPGTSSRRRKSPNPLFPACSSRWKRESAS